jgi:hypothetical protein
MIVSQEEQCEPAVKPDSVHVGSIAASVTMVCPVAEITVCLTMIASQAEQCEPAVKPDSVQVGSIAPSVTMVCPVAGIVAVSEKSQEHFLVFSPFSVQVGFFVTSHLLKEWW